MQFKRINKNTTEYLSDEDALSEKETIRDTGSDRLAKALDASEKSEWDKTRLELEYNVES